MTDGKPTEKRRRIGVTARAIVLHLGRVLLLRVEEPGRTWYFLPGGHVEHGERLEDACRREVFEETGVAVNVERALYLREFIAERHKRRSPHMPSHHHVLGLLFLCHIDGRVHRGTGPKFPGRFRPEADRAGGVVDLEWVDLGRIPDIEIMPPHVKEALTGEFPPPDAAGVEFWPEE